jgi:RNA polymerase-binding transcription factor DksA
MSQNSDEFVERERIKLESEKVEIEAKIQHLREWLKGEVDIDAEEGDPDLFEREKHLALLTTLERRLEQTQTALRAIDKGLYGICERCGKPIDPERLEVKPDATMCLPCQQEVERLIRRGLAAPQIDWER